MDHVGAISGLPNSQILCRRRTVVLKLVSAHLSPFLDLLTRVINNRIVSCTELTFVLSAASCVFNLGIIICLGSLYSFSRIPAHHLQREKEDNACIIIQ